jgi:glycosyltransferase involved in cell wall biosynthesis
MENLALQPLVSICIPCYNAGAFIQETLKSVFSQTYRNIKVVVCDDCSTDNSVEKVKEMNDSRLELVVNPRNLGQIANYNNALSHAVGKYTKLLCDDDILEPECIEKQVRAFEMQAGKNVVLVTANRKNIINEKGERVLSMKIFPGEGFFNGKKMIKKIAHRGNIIGEPGAPLMLTDALQKVPVVYEDMDMWIRILVHGNLFVMDDTVFNFRISLNSLTSTSAHRWWSGMKYYNSILDRCGACPDSGLTKYDIAIGKAIAFLRGLARSFFVGMVLRKNR